MSRATNYDVLFSTPERAAQTLAKKCGQCETDTCWDCPLGSLTGFNPYESALLEWLGKVAERGDITMSSDTRDARLSSGR